MPLAIPPDLKKISGYIRRAEELDKDMGNPESTLVAYYLRQYAVSEGIPISQNAASSPDTKTCLLSILETLEEQKTKMNAFTPEEAAFLCRQFAAKIFDKADEEDRAGLATKGTAKTFYAAATFLQILDQFNSDETGPADKKQILYAKWKATDILKALKEGRVPKPGPQEDETPSEEDEEETAADTESAMPPAETNADTAPVSDEDADEEMLLPPPAPVAPPSAPKEEGTEVGLDGEEMDLPKPPPPAYPGHGSPNRSRPPVSFDLSPAPLPPPMPPPSVPAPAPKPAKPAGSWFGKKKNDASSGKVSKAEWADATELTRFAMAAIEDKDADVAVERLRQALAILER